MKYINKQLPKYGMRKLKVGLVSGILGVVFVFSPIAFNGFIIDNPKVLAAPENTEKSSATVSIQEYSKGDKKIKIDVLPRILKGNVKVVITPKDGEKKEYTAVEDGIRYSLDLKSNNTTVNPGDKIIASFEEVGKEIVYSELVSVRIEGENKVDGKVDFDGRIIYDGDNKTQSELFIEYNGKVYDFKDLIVKLTKGDVINVSGSASTWLGAKKFPLVQNFGLKKFEFGEWEETVEENVDFWAVTKSSQVSTGKSVNISGNTPNLFVTLGYDTDNDVIADIDDLDDDGDNVPDKEEFEKGSNPKDANNIPAFKLEKPSKIPGLNLEKTIKKDVKPVDPIFGNTTIYTGIHSVNFVNPSVLDPSNCFVKPYLELKEVQGIKYIVKYSDGTVISNDAHGRLEYEYGKTIIVTAVVTDGYTMKEAVQTVFEYTSEKSQLCEVPKLNDNKNVDKKDNNYCNNQGNINQQNNLNKDVKINKSENPNTSDAGVLKSAMALITSVAALFATKKKKEN